MLLGSFGVKSAAPIVLTPQSCALALGAITDTVVPNPDAKDGEDIWKVITVVLSCFFARFSLMLPFQ
jgi:pyruvate/2-oxoglutarate dehydrogenase complex dihydrolipoamide acyltransferase (E2) component